MVRENPQEPQSNLVRIILSNVIPIDSKYNFVTVCTLKTNDSSPVSPTVLGMVFF